MRTVKETAGYGPEQPAADEQFTERAVINQILQLLVEPTYGLNEPVATVSAEWERKSALVRGPIDDPHSYRYRPETDDLVVSLELRIDGFSRTNPAAAKLQEQVRAIIAQRAEARAAAEVAELEAAIEAKEVELTERQAELAALRAERSEKASA